MPQAAADAEAVGAIFEIAGVDLRALQELGPVESQSPQFGLQFCGVEEELEGLSGGGYTFGERIERLSLAGVEQRGIDSEIEDHATASGHFRDHAERGHAGFAREIGRHT